ncbi:hypothetical protein Agub_g12378, partial [Astrephomene gubernaculifera]
LDFLNSNLVAADEDLQAKARVSQMQFQLANAEARVEAAERAALAAAAERHQMEARLARALAESSEGRAMVMELSAEIARYREEVERVQSRLIAKQALIDAQEVQRATAQNAQMQAEPAAAPDQHQLRPCDSFAVEIEDEDAVEGFMEGCIWGVGLGALRSPVSGVSVAHRAGDGLSSPIPPVGLALAAADGDAAGSVVAGPSPQPRTPLRRFGQVDLTGSTLHLEAAGSDLLELMAARWHGSPSRPGSMPAGEAPTAAANADVITPSTAPNPQA